MIINFIYKIPLAKMCLCLIVMINDDKILENVVCT